jgi:hypothetical protein
LKSASRQQFETTPPLLLLLPLLLLHVDLSS